MAGSKAERGWYLLEVGGTQCLLGDECAVGALLPGWSSGLVLLCSSTFCQSSTTVAVAPDKRMCHQSPDIRPFSRAYLVRCLCLDASVSVVRIMKRKVMSRCAVTNRNPLHREQSPITNIFIYFVEMIYLVRFNRLKSSPPL